MKRKKDWKSNNLEIDYTIITNNGDKISDYFLCPFDDLNMFYEYVKRHYPDCKDIIFEKLEMV